MSSQKSQRGVTWKEGLAAAAIVIVTGAILCPGPFVPPRGNARRAECQSNMKQLGLAFTQYEQDNDGEFPPGRTLGGEGWAGQLYPWIKSTGIYHCPADTESDPYISYAENLRLEHRNMTDVADLAVTIESYEDTTTNCDPSTSEMSSATGLTAPQDSPRHDPTAYSLDFLAIDGHTKWLKPGRVSSGPGALPARKITQNRNGPAVLTFAIK